MMNSNKSLSRKERESNLELLRIVAMVLVMFGHTHLRMHPMSQSGMELCSILNIVSSCISTMGVGIFISISGWFGIMFKVSGLTKYIFQILFVLWAVYGLAITLGYAGLSFEGIKVSIGLYDGYWFIIGYLGLYLISPVLNVFIDKATKKEYQVLLLSLLLFQCVYSWLTAWYDYYNGYSIILFAVIYLTAAYFRKFPIAWVEKHAHWLFIITVVVMAAIATLSLWKFGNAARQIRDDNPLVVLGGILLLLSFNKLKFHSKIVNWLAASCFTVYLLHYSPFAYPHLMAIMREVYAQYDGAIYCLVLLMFLIAVYFCCTLFDQLRILAWRSLSWFMNKKEI
jgi:surface polysaccharide O-acyltransferase-like enzyme